MEEKSSVLLTETMECVKKRGFDVAYASSAKEALEIVMNEVHLSANVGWGGSQTLKEIGVKEAALASGAEVREYRNDCDLFLLSANAVTKDGRIVNIDGRGNRVASSICGPRRVVYVIGRNKLVDGGLDEAVARIKKFACAPNCRRLGKNTPCAATGVCTDCDSPDRICKVMAVFERRPTGVSALAVFVDEDLGY